MRIGSMVKQLLEEVRSGSLDEASRERLAEIYERSVAELSEAMSPDLQEELRALALPFTDDHVPSESELRIAKAQLVGWLEGLFHGIQATLFAQQLAARQQLEQMRQLPPGPTGPAASPSPTIAQARICSRRPPWRSRRCAWLAVRLVRTHAAPPFGPESLFRWSPGAASPGGRPRWRSARSSG